jgi:hypothetical protein
MVVPHITDDDGEVVSGDGTLRCLDLPVVVAAVILRQTLRAHLQGNFITLHNHLLL